VLSGWGPATAPTRGCRSGAPWWVRGLFADDLRDKERAKIECGKAHFKALAVREEVVEYRVARSVDEVLAAS